jgi:hypothetical protein
MGLEARCQVRFGRQRGEGKALLETETVLFRGPFKLDIHFKDIKQTSVKAGALRIVFSDGEAIFELGAAAEKWREKIANPRKVIDKLGVKAQHRVSVVGAADEAFLVELRGRAAELCVGKAARRSDLIFFGAERAGDLERLAALKASLEPKGALWVLRKKGASAQVTESAVRTAARAAGLVDVKVVAFSPSHTAEKLVIPVAKR